MDRFARFSKSDLGLYANHRDADLPIIERALLDVTSPTRQGSFLQIPVARTFVADRFSDSLDNAETFHFKVESLDSEGMSGCRIFSLLHQWKEEIKRYRFLRFHIRVLTESHILQRWIGNCIVQF
jgi:hypothetical protein